MGTGNDLARVLGWGVKYVGDEHEIDELLQDFENATRTPFDRYADNILGPNNVRLSKTALCSNCLHLRGMQGFSGQKMSFSAPTGSCISCLFCFDE